MTAIDASPVATQPTETASAPSIRSIQEPARVACTARALQPDPGPREHRGQLADARTQVAARYGVNARHTGTAAPQVAGTLTAAADLPRPVLEV